MHPHCEALKTVLEAGQSSMSRDGSVFVYNPNTVREQFAGLVIQEGLPFNNFDNTIMKRVFQNHLQPKFIHLLIESIMVDLECFDDGFATKAKERFTVYFQGKGINVSHSIPNGPGYAKCSSYFGSFQIRFFNKWTGVINPKKKTNTSFFGDVYVSKGSLGSTRSNSKTHQVLNTPWTLKKMSWKQRCKIMKQYHFSMKRALDEAATEAMSNGSDFGGEDVDLTLSESD
ncbi:hypothetical protein Tco_1078623 [Tanacetum coccineum]|uniref:Uncharacterized protein n=1 Tax=Tanacetum coccineum TaxID=301880 RepID=A0ABQ5HPI2_9ASTR